MAAGTGRGQAVPEEEAEPPAGDPPWRRLTSAGWLRFGRGALALVVLLCGVTLVLGFANKDRCTGTTFDAYGRSVPEWDERKYADVCYSDIQHLWIGRDIDRHVFPYVNGSLQDGSPVGGVVEYPVLTGLLIWVSALPVDTDAGFLLSSALLMAPFGLLTAWLLGRMSRWRALLWAIGPPLVLYAFHNWELPVVACAVAAMYVVHFGWRRAYQPLVTRATVAAVLLGLGFAFKVYPAIFTLPLMLYVLTGGPGGTELPPDRRWDVAGAIRVALVAMGTAVLVNLPFMLLGFTGWKASFDFQMNRTADISSNSIWFWGLRPYSDPDNTEVHELINVLSLSLMAASFLLACLLGWRRYRNEGSFPWIPVCAAMLCGFLLLHKVHSPQYTLWLVPMFVLLRIRWGWIIAYLIADIAMEIGIFRWYHLLGTGEPSGIYDGVTAQLLMVGVWGRAALLVGLFFAFLAAKSTVDREVRGPELARRLN